MTYPVGSFFLVPVGGLAGFGIGLGQLLCMRPSAYAHAGVVISPDGGIIEAEPGGARLANLSEYAGRPIRVCDGPVQSWAATSGASPEQVAAKRQQVALNALTLRHTPYSAADYLALACLHWRLPSAWVRQRVRDSGHMICSQLVVETLRRAGIDLFPADTFCGDYMPSDLANYADAWEESRRVAAAA